MPNLPEGKPARFHLLRTHRQHHQRHSMTNNARQLNIIRFCLTQYQAGDFRYVIVPVLTYGAESWTLSEKHILMLGVE